MHKNKGYLLVERAISIVILGICLPLFVSSYFHALINFNYGETVNTAVFLAEAQIERITSLRFQDVICAAPFTCPGGQGQYQCQVVVSTAAPTGMTGWDPTKCKQVQVIVSHPNLPNSITLTSIVSRYNEW